MFGYIYFIHTKECIDLNLPIYKIGRTVRDNPYLRLNNYTRGYVIYVVLQCNHAIEMEQLCLHFFREKYNRRLDYGLEYFEGDKFDMMRDLMSFRLMDLSIQVITQHKKSGGSLNNDLSSDLNIGGSSSGDFSDNLNIGGSLSGSSSDNLNIGGSSSGDLSGDLNIGGSSSGSSSDNLNISGSLSGDLSGNLNIGGSSSGSLSGDQSLQTAVSLSNQPLQKKYTCNYCDQSFVKKYNLDVHVKKACRAIFIEKQSTDTCPHCQIKFSTKGNCKRHIETCTKNPNNVQGITVTI